jgi:hypothetical protein
MVTDAAACAIAADQPHRAVELLEAGRAVLWTQALHLRSDLSRLTERAPDWAGALEQARAELEQPLPAFTLEDLHDNPAYSSDRASLLLIHQEALERRRRAARQWDDVLAQVRRLKGFETFLAPRPYADLRPAARDGPIVIVNASSIGCHALIITADPDSAVQVLHLTDFTYNDVADRAQALLDIQHRASDTARPFLEQEKDRHAVFDILEWLWDATTRPVLDHLGHTRTPSEEIEKWPRVWWCPTGPLSMLPLHAAGHHPRNRIQQDRQEGSTSGDIVAARVVSSYTPTITALLSARRAPGPGTVRQLAIGMPETPGQDPLPAATAELHVLARYLPPPCRARHLVGFRATRAEVRDAIADYSWLHLACHGWQHPADPSGSAFALYDGPLTVADLAALHLEQADLAYLSACQTAAGDMRLPDEAIHLAAAMQLLGYRHVIATLWTIADNPAPAIADIIYARLTATGHPDPSRAAHALHEAVTTLRHHYPDQPLIWVPYIHIGP